ncbi:MAG: exodeoxyribonuclease VII large subunit, partial [Desulfuromonas sp.]
MTAVISVTSLVACLQELIEDNFVDVMVQGELSNVSLPASGHCYFTLKDSKAQIRCAIFRSSLRALRFQPRDGMAVVCRGRLSVYPQRGDLQLIVEAMEPEGIGRLQLAFDQLKEKLAAEGLFADEHKQELPAYPETIGIVTSATGAAIRDIFNVLQRRSAGIRVLLCPVRVQGEEAAAEIAAAIADLNREGNADVLIVGRGGGSREDLWAFNEEVVARAIHASRIPIISAVGHETDYSISDLVADLRAPTPSAAAELVVRNRLDLERHLDQLVLRLGQRMGTQLRLLRSRLEGLEKRLKAPAEQLRYQRLRFEQLETRLQQRMESLIRQRQQNLAVLSGRLDALSPLRVLARGYAIVKHAESGKGLSDSAQVTIGASLDIHLARGAVGAVVASLSPSL